MRRIARTFAGVCALATLAGLSACEDKVPFGNFVTPVPIANFFTVTPLIGDNDALGAPVVDPNLVNPWGIAFGPTGLLWVANNGTGTATVYSATGEKQSLVVSIPSPTDATGGGRPTGVIFNPTTDFAIGTTGPAAFLFAGEDGVISAWNTSSGTTAQVVATHAGSVYKALTMASNGGENFIYATDFHNNRVDMYDASFTLTQSFTDTSIPLGFAPFGIQNIAGKIFVTYAKQLLPDAEDDDPGVGNGFVVVFNPDGSVAQRFAANGSLNSPWAITVAPAGFGPFAGAVLIGNFGDGKIGAYNAATGAFMDFLNDANGSPITLEGLWGMQFGPTSQSTTLYFASGPGDEAHGLVGTITPVTVP
jgi:uncharacterized protein (TIGR03118 family)